jgi:hypothetical protein
MHINQYKHDLIKTEKNRTPKAAPVNQDWI